MKKTLGLTFNLPHWSGTKLPFRCCEGVTLSLGWHETHCYCGRWGGRHRCAPGAGSGSGAGVGLAYPQLAEGLKGADPEPDCHRESCATSAVTPASSINNDKRGQPSGSMTKSSLAGMRKKGLPLVTALHSDMGLLTPFSGGSRIGHCQGQDMGLEGAWTWSAMEIPRTFAAWFLN